MQTPTPTTQNPELPAPPPPRWSRLDLVTGALLLISFCCAWAMASLGALHGNDFKHLWLGARLLGMGRNIYDAELFRKAAASSGFGSINPFVYLPSTGLMLRPLAELSYGAALLAWFWFNWVLAWAVVLAGPTLLRVARPATARLAGAAFLAGSFTFFRQQTAGQMNVVTAALILGAAAGLIRGRSFWCGLCLALGFGWKIAPALLIGALAPLRRWRALAWGCGLAAALMIVSIGVYGWPVHRAALPVLRQMGYGQSTWAESNDFYRSPFNQSFNSLFHHLLTPNPYTRPWVEAPPGLANRMTMVVAILLGVGWLMQVARRMWRDCGLRIADCGLKNSLNPQSAIRNPQSDHAAFLPPLFLAASLAMLLLPSLMWDHYAVQALPALIWVFGHGAVERSTWRALLAVGIFGGLAVLWLHTAPAWQHGAGILLMSLRLWPMLALYLWLLLDPGLRDETDSAEIR